tara:strand:+ start:3537 stop:4418 length:882 start_codon:yes stop_codon:yes gene_type:complete
MKKKVMILGSTGLIGHQVYTYLKKKNKYELFNISKSKLNSDTIILDATDYLKLEKEIFNIRPHFIVNCIGILIEKSEKYPDIAKKLNSKLPKQLQKTSEKLNSKIIHMSTDCVFSGVKGNYNENDIPDGVSAYAKSKIKGEIDNKNHLTIRTSVIGPELKKGTELFDWFMREKNEVNGYTGSIWSGVTTLELSKMVFYCIENNINGIYNFSSLVPTTKYKLLITIKDVFSKDIYVKKIIGVKTNKVLIDNRKLFNFKVPDYKTMIEDLYYEMKNNLSTYPQYCHYFGLNNDVL